MTGDRRSDGFTLIELLLAIAIIGIILFPLTDAIIAAISNQQGVTNRMDYSHNANLVATYLDPDLASANATPAAEATPCSATATKLTVNWSDPAVTPNGTSQTTSYQAVYSVVDLSGSGTNWVLQRVYTRSGSLGSQTSTSYVAHDLAGLTSVCVSVSGNGVQMSVTQGSGSNAYTFYVNGQAAAREIS